MRYYIIIAFFVILVNIMAQPFPKLQTGPTPHAPNQKPPFSAYAVWDVAGDYSAYYQKYLNNTKILEDEHFSEKVLVSKTPQCTTYDLVFTHWLIGELFRLREQHYFGQSNGQALGLSHVLDAQTTVKVWVVKKFLRAETKDSWVGDNFNHLDVYIAFLEIAPQRTRLYYQIAIDADERRTLQSALQEAKDGLQNIYNLK